MPAPTFSDDGRSPVEGDLVTVVIPARNEESTIAECLESVMTQDFRNLEILVIDGASEDRTVEITERLAVGDPRVHIIRNEGRIIPAALNVGLGAARGRWLVRVDAHSTVPPDYVSRAIAYLDGAAYGGVGGRKDALGLTPVGRAIAASLGSPLGVGGSLYHHATRAQTVDHIPFGAYPTDLLREVGGWNERLLANEDFELDYRLRQQGYELLFIPDLRITWKCRQSIPDLFRQYRRYGQGKALVALLHPRSLAPRQLAPPALVLLLGSMLLARRLRGLAFVLIPYAGFVAFSSVVVARKLDDTAARRSVPAVFVAMHAGYGLGFWQGILTRAGRRARPALVRPRSARW